MECLKVGGSRADFRFIKPGLCSQLKSQEYYSQMGVFYLGLVIRYTILIDAYYNHELLAISFVREVRELYSPF